LPATPDIDRLFQLRGLKDLVRRLLKAGVTEVGIERPDGPVVDALLGAGLTVLVIPPAQVKNLRGRYGPPVTRTTGSTHTCWPTWCWPTWCWPTWCAPTDARATHPSRPATAVIAAHSES